METARYIHETVKSFLPYYKQPRIIEFTDELPKTIRSKQGIIDPGDNENAIDENTLMATAIHVSSLNG